MTCLPCKHLFELPDDVVYLDGNSLGPLPRGAVEAARHTMQHEWGGELIRAWNSAGWMDLPREVGNMIAPVIGVPEGSVATGDTLSIKVYQALAAALKLRPQRRVILSDEGNFPTDLYMADGLIRLLGDGHELRAVPRGQIVEAVSQEVAAVLLTHVDYRTGEMYDMKAITETAHRAGAVMIWDLAHSAGAVPLDITASNAEFAVGCTYKYLNGGPGAPAFIYARPDIIEQTRPALQGWLGHAEPFAMAPDYRPAMTTERLRVGTPAIIQLAVLRQALELWTDVDMNELRAASVHLSERFIREVERRCPMLKLASPRDPSMRGSQVSFAFEHGYAAMQALIANGVIGDFRQPNIMRFGFTPLYLDEQDIVHAAERLEEVMSNETWREQQFQTVSRVT